MNRDCLIKTCHACLLTLCFACTHEGPTIDLDGLEHIYEHTDDRVSQKTYLRHADGAIVDVIHYSVKTKAEAKKACDATQHTPQWLAIGEMSATFPLKDAPSGQGSAVWFSTSASVNRRSSTGVGVCYPRNKEALVFRLANVGEIDEAAAVEFLQTKIKK